jgi:hypothetical protein
MTDGTPQLASCSPARSITEAQRDSIVNILSNDFCARRLGEMSAVFA